MKHRRILALAAALCLLLTLCACGRETEAEATTETTSETVTVLPEETPEPEIAQLGSGRLDGFSAAFVGAELFTAADGSEALRVYLDFENTGEDSASPFERMSICATQDGEILYWAQSGDDSAVAEEGNLSLRLQSGKSTRCALQYTLVSGSAVSITLSDPDGGSISAYLPLNDLPGAPDPLPEAETDSAETVTAELDSSCTLYELYEVTILGGEVSSDADERIVTVSILFTNKGDSMPVSPFGLFLLHVYQDGVELSAVDLGELEPVSVASGESYTLELLYTLRSDSPLFIELSDLWENTPCAQLSVPIA